MELKFQMDFGTGFQPCDPPINADGIMLRIIFVDDLPNASIENLDLEWVGQNAVRLNNYRKQGLTGGRGIYEGVGLRIYGCQNASSPDLLFFDGYIDLANEQTSWECDKVIAPCKETGKIDWMNDICSAISFDYLRSLTGNAAGRIIPQQDYKLTPYVVTEIPDYTQAMILALSEFMMFKELFDVTTKIAQLIASLTGDTATAVATVGAASGSLIATITVTVLYVTYLFLIITAIINMTKMLVQNIIQTKKYKACMTFQRMFLRITQYFGLQFSSPIVGPGAPYQHVTWMPAKSIIPNTTNPLTSFKRSFDESVGFPNNTNVSGHYAGNCADFIRDACTIFKAEIKIVGNVLYFVPINYFLNQATFTIPNVGPVGFAHNYNEPYSTNAAELPANYYLKYQVDPTELNTLHRYQGSSISVNVSPLTTYNVRRVLLQNGVRVDLPCAMAKRKAYLSRVENFLNNVIGGLFGFVNFVTSAINGLINAINTAITFFGGNPATIGTIPQLPTNVLNNRIGWLELSGDTFGIPKIFIGQQQGSDWIIAANNDLLMSAQQLFNRYHGKVMATRGNQQLVYRDKQFAFCCQDYVKLLNRNVVLDPLGRSGRIRELTWDLKNEQAINVEYRIFANFTNNLKETITIDGNG